MEVSSDKSGGTLHQSNYDYPANLRLLGYAANILPPTSPQSATVEVSASSILPTSSASPKSNGIVTLRRNLIFSDSEKAAATLLWTTGNNTPVSSQEHQNVQVRLKATTSDTTEAYSSKKEESSECVSSSLTSVSLKSHHHRDSPEQEISGGTSLSASGNAQLMHWMSAVMAEHITHHTAVDGVHYVWNGATMVEGKLSSPDGHLHNTVKSEMDPTSPLGNSIYGAPGSNNSASSIASSPHSSAELIVPQPLSSGGGLTGNGKNTANGGAKKYQCKMCPQVGDS